MRTPESSYIAAVNRQVKRDAPNIKHIKFALRFNNGWPDSAYFAPDNQLLWIEFKVHPNTTTPQQRKTIAELRALGQKVAIMTLRDGFTIIDDGDQTLSVTHPHTWILSTLNVKSAPPRYHVPPAPGETKPTGPPTTVSLPLTSKKHGVKKLTPCT